jgi:hypothetical protein
MKISDFIKIFIVMIIATSIPCFLLWASLRGKMDVRTKHSSQVTTRIIEGNETKIETIREVIKKEDGQIKSLRDEISRLTSVINQNEVDLDTALLIASQRSQIKTQDLLIGSLDFKVLRLDEIIQLQDQNIEVLKLDNSSLIYENGRLQKDVKKMKRQRNLVAIGAGAVAIAGITISIIK